MCYKLVTALIPKQVVLCANNHQATRRAEIKDNRRREKMNSRQK